MKIVFSQTILVLIWQTRTNNVKADTTLSPSPSALPSLLPSSQPSSMPSSEPSLLPSSMPSLLPSNLPSEIPSDLPSCVPSTAPSYVPSLFPSFSPSSSPSESLEPSAGPSGSPSEFPSSYPSLSVEPSLVPSTLPSLSNAPSSLTSLSVSPSISNAPTKSSKAGKSNERNLHMRMVQSSKSDGCATSRKTKSIKTPKSTKAPNVKDLSDDSQNLFSNAKSGLSTGETVGVVSGAIVAIAIAFVPSMLFLRSKRRNASKVVGEKKVKRKKNVKSEFHSLCESGSFTTDKDKYHIENVDNDNNDKKKKAKPDAKQEASAPSKPSKILYLEPTDYKIDFDLLCGGIIQNIFSYIPSTRGLFTLSQMSKRLRSLLTYEHIVRVVVLSEKNEKIKDLENLISSCTEARFIYMPSVQRLLRMMVSSKCELGEECWAYNMEEERPGRVTSHGYQSGLHLCYQCEEAYFHGHQMLGRWSRTWVDQTLTECFGSNCRWKNFLPTKDFFEQSTGEPIGPFLEIKDFKSIEATYKNLCVWIKSSEI